MISLIKIQMTIHYFCVITCDIHYPQTRLYCIFQLLSQSLIQSPPSVRTKGSPQIIKFLPSSKLFSKLTSSLYIKQLMVEAQYVISSACKISDLYKSRLYPPELKNKTSRGIKNNLFPAPLEFPVRVYDFFHPDWKNPFVWLYLFFPFLLF